MYSIGTFSKITKITTKTLRYYDEIGLLKPNHVDDLTGYRYYVKEQLPTLYLINTLKLMGLSLNQIKDILREPELAHRFLAVKAKEILNTIESEKLKLMRIRSYLATTKEDITMTNDIEIKSLPEITVASMRQIIPNYQTLFHLMPNIMGKEMKELGCICREPSYCFNIYHDGEFKEENIDVEMCEAVTEKKNNTDILTFKIIDAVPTAVCVMHKGAYQNLGGAYGFAFKWIEDNGYEIIDNPRESYIDGIWNKESEDDWLTEIQIPVVKK